MTIGDTAVCVEVTNSDGDATGRIVFVPVTYSLERDFSYGACADGRHGETVYTVEILDVCISHYDLQTLNSLEVEQILDSARRKVLSCKAHPITH